jgi:hypothetical protein
MARPYHKHQLTSLVKAVKAEGLAGLDGRSKVARALAEWRSEIGSTRRSSSDSRRGDGS